MLQWLKLQWKLSVYVLSSPGHQETILSNEVLRMLVLDVHRAQKTDLIKTTFKSLHTTMAIVPSGCTSLVQPLDVCINKPFKDQVKAAADNHYHNNLAKWMEGKQTESLKENL